MDNYYGFWTILNKVGALGGQIGGLFYLVYLVLKIFRLIRGEFGKGYKLKYGHIESPKKHAIVGSSNEWTWFIPFIKLKKRNPDDTVIIEKAYIFFKFRKDMEFGNYPIQPHVGIRRGDICRYDASAYRKEVPKRVPEVGEFEMGKFLIPTDFFLALDFNSIFFCIEDGKGKKSFTTVIRTAYDDPKEKPRQRNRFLLDWLRYKWLMRSSRLVYRMRTCTQETGGHVFSVEKLPNFHDPTLLSGILDGNKEDLSNVID
jgi:hypothetical protein